MTAAAPARRKAFPIWFVIGIGGLLTSVSLGVRSTFGVFLNPVVDSVLDGMQGPYGIAIAVQSIMWGLSQPVAGAISDKYGAAVTFSGGAVLYSLSLLLMSIADSAFMIIFAGGLLTGIALGAASFSVVLTAVGRMVSPARRSMALGAVSALGSLGQFALVPLSRRLIDNVGWETTFVIFAGILIATIVFTPAVRGSASRNFPELEQVGADRTLREDFRRAAAHKPYWLLNLAFLVCGFHVTFIGTYLPRHGIDLGHEAAATTALALIGLFNVFGSLAAGALGGKYSKTMLLAGIYGLRGVVIVLYILLPSSSTLTIVFGAAIGVLWLSTVPLTSAMVVDMFGTTHSGALFGLVFVSHQIGSLGGALSGGQVHDASGSYDIVWWAAVALGVVGMLAHVLITEGPAPEPPDATTTLGRLAPTGGAASVLLVLGVLSIFTLTDAASATGDQLGDLVAWCFSTS